MSRIIESITLFTTEHRTESNILARNTFFAKVVTYIHGFYKHVTIKLKRHTLGEENTLILQMGILQYVFWNGEIGISSLTFICVNILGKKEVDICMVAVDLSFCMAIYYGILSIHRHIPQTLLNIPFTTWSIWNKTKCRCEWNVFWQLFENRYRVFFFFFFTVLQLLRIFPPLNHRYIKAELSLLGADDKCFHLYDFLALWYNFDDSELYLKK